MHDRERFCQWWKLMDCDRDERRKFGASPIEHAEARQWNSIGYGIFWSVNDFRDGRRVAENLERINAWYVEIDDGEKSEQERRIATCGLEPSMVNETARGYHVYFNAVSATPGYYNEIVDRLVHRLQGDRDAKGITRLLRVPGFYHLKDPANPVLVKTRYTSGAAYTETQMLRFFPPVPRKETEAKRPEKKPNARSKLGALLDQTDHREILSRLSGHPAVRGEVYTFREQRNGKANIVVNGEETACWIDERGRIGSRSRGGPTIYQWLMWMGNTKDQVTAVLREIYPEWFDENGRVK